MAQFIALLIHEMRLLKIAGLYSNLFWMIVINGICLPMALSPEQISNIAPLLLIIYLPGALLNIASNSLKADAADGSLDLALITCGRLHVVLSKLLSLCVSSFVSIALSMPLFVFFFNMSWPKLFTVFFCACIISWHSCCLGFLLAAIQTNFSTKPAIIASVTMPLLVPEIVLCGMLISRYNSAYAILSIGIFVTILALSIGFSQLLLRRE